jgi:hypothetical protein
MSHSDHQDEAPVSPAPLRDLETALTIAIRRGNCSEGHAWADGFPMNCAECDAVSAAADHASNAIEYALHGVEASEAARVDPELITRLVNRGACECVWDDADLVHRDPNCPLHDLLDCLRVAESAMNQWKATAEKRLALYEEAHHRASHPAASTPEPEARDDLAERLECASSSSSTEGE